MIDRVIILSADDLRGNIIEKVLILNSFQVTFLKSYFEAEEALCKNVSGIIIYDAKSFLLRKPTFLERLHHDLKDRPVIALVDPSTVTKFEAQPFPKWLFLSDPLDPELIVSKVKEMLAQKSGQLKAPQDILLVSPDEPSAIIGSRTAPVGERGENRQKEQQTNPEEKDQEQKISKGSELLSRKLRDFLKLD